MRRSKNWIILPLASEIDRRSAGEQRAVGKIVSVAVAIFGRKCGKVAIRFATNVNEIAALR